MSRLPVDGHLFHAAVVRHRHPPRRRLLRGGPARAGVRAAGPGSIDGEPHPVHAEPCRCVAGRRGRGDTPPQPDRRRPAGRPGTARRHRSRRRPTRGPGPRDRGQDRADPAGAADPGEPDAAGGHRSEDEPRRSLRAPPARPRQLPHACPLLRRAHREPRLLQAHPGQQRPHPVGLQGHPGPGRPRGEPSGPAAVGGPAPGAGRPAAPRRRAGCAHRDPQRPCPSVAASRRDRRAAGCGQGPDRRAALARAPRGRACSPDPARCRRQRHRREHGRAGAGAARRARGGGEGHGRGERDRRPAVPVRRGARLLQGQRLRLLGLDLLRPGRRGPGLLAHGLGPVHVLGRNRDQVAGSRSTRTPVTPTWSSRAGASTPRRSAAEGRGGRGSSGATQVSWPVTHLACRSRRRR